jgi:MinD-like ATPase involved in chromosome partitioning or flagellar assembly
MNIVFWTHYEEYAAEFKAHYKYYGDTVTCLDAESSFSDDHMKTCNVLVIFDDNMDCERVIQNIESVTERAGETDVRVIVAITDFFTANKSERLKKYCLSNNLEFVSPEKSVPVFIRELSHILYKGINGDVERRRLIAFVGTTPNNGTTVAAFGTAINLALSTQARILYLCLNLKSSKIHRYLGVDDPYGTLCTLDAIRPELKARSLRPGRFQQYCDKVKGVPNLYVMYGNLMREQSDYMTPDDVEYLLETARSAFDLCIFEVSAYWDNAATICGAMTYADTRIVVTTPELGQFQEDFNRWVKSMTFYFQEDIGMFDLFVTQYVPPSASGYRLKDIRKETRLNIIGQMRRHECVQQYLNEGRIVDLFMQYKPAAKDLSGIAATLRQLYRLPVSEPRAEKLWIRKFIAGSGAKLTAGTKIGAGSEMS